MKILVADDIRSNRLLIETYLQETSHVLTFVEDGAAAVEQFRNADFDLILMDMRMPCVDGISATRAIRAIERERGAKAVPIIALTACTWVEEEARCREAGCTSHLAKPLSQHQLLEALENHAAPGSRRCAGLRCPGAGLPSPVLVEIPAGFEKYVPEYLHERKQDCERLAHLIASRAFEQIHTLAHNMKGTGRSYGFDWLTELGSAMEHSVSAADVDALTAQLEDLKQYLERVRLHPAQSVEESRSPVKL